jgi:homoserine O-acetyltransferase
MELSVLPAPDQSRVPDCDGSTPASREPLLVDVPLPADLSRFGRSVQATALGNPANPAVVALGGISANCFVARRADGSPGWWSGLVGEGAAIDPARHYIIGMDFAADESGRIAPSTADQSRVLAAVLDALAVRRPATLVGASYGGMVALALAQAQPERVARLVIISAGAEPHPAATAARELQRRVVALGLETGRGDEALAIARGMGMLTYRTSAEFAERFPGGIDAACPRTRSAPGAYLGARGEAFRSVMSPGRFLSLSASIDRHRIEPLHIRHPVLIIGADSDQLVLAVQLQQLEEKLAGPSELHLLGSLYGHDMFLKETGRIGRIVRPFLDSGR